MTGVDPAARLLDVARQRAASSGYDIQVRQGEAGSIPADDASADVILSVFGVIFAADPAVAAGEMSRVLAPGGRILLSAWIPGGAIGDVNAAAARLVREALGAPPPEHPFSWHDPDALGGLFAPYGLQVSAEQHSLAFTAPSPAEYLDREASSHPVALAGLGVLSQRGMADEARGQFLEILQRGNEDPSGFRCTSRYIVASMQ